tara:strand:- start:13 stop:249 length:237 start_codon:yes stop_codon:yes gene_type:complete
MTSINLILAEIERQRNLPNAAEIAATEAENSTNDRIAIAIAYLGRASEKVHRNERDGCIPKDNLVKAAAVICAAIDNA